MSKALKQKPASLQWENKVGLASILGVIQIISLFVGGGVLYGVLTTKMDVATSNVLDLKQTTSLIIKDANHRDDKVSAQDVRIGKIETAVGFMQSGIQRIEAALSK